VFRAEWRLAGHPATGLAVESDRFIRLSSTEEAHYGQEEKENGGEEDHDAQTQDDAHRHQAQEDSQENINDEACTAAGEARRVLDDALI
jgi:hypothetical protein